MGEINRRDFLKLSGAATLGAAFAPELLYLASTNTSNFERLGRVLISQVDVKAEPATKSSTLGLLYEDAVVDWQREVVGSSPNRINQRFVQVPDGFSFPSVAWVFEKRPLSISSAMWASLPK